MNNTKSDTSYWKFRKTIGVSKMLGMAFVTFVALAVMPIYIENAYSQSTLYQCNSNTGINTGSFNCFNNNNTPSYNNSNAAINNQTTNNQTTR